MIVKCINNEGTKDLIKGEFYTVKLKRKWDSSLVLLDISGVFNCYRFQKPDGKIVTYNDYIQNYHYHPTYEMLSKIKYAKLKKSSQLKSLKKETFYKVRSFSENWDGTHSTSFENILPSYKSNNFIYYTEDDYISLLRKEKLFSIKEKIKQNT